MLKKEKNSEVITLLVKPSEKKKIKKMAAEMGIGMNALLKVSFATFHKQMENLPVFEMSDSAKAALEDAHRNKHKAISTNGRKASEVLRELL